MLVTFSELPIESGFLSLTLLLEFSIPMVALEDFIINNGSRFTVHGNIEISWSWNTIIFTNFMVTYKIIILSNYAIIDAI